MNNMGQTSTAMVTKAVRSDVPWSSGPLARTALLMQYNFITIKNKKIAQGAQRYPAQRYIYLVPYHLLGTVNFMAKNSNLCAPSSRLETILVLFDTRLSPVSNMFPINLFNYITFQNRKNASLYVFCKGQCNFILEDTPSYTG